ncbi:MAG: hypothetical protein K6A36_04795 [Paludibacteraceae bacterium]|nr:hypothetical protein [Paludibacteraceae bacterium]
MRKFIFIILILGAMSAVADNSHFVRVSADFPYARDMGGASVDMSALSLQEAQDLMYIGNAEALERSNGVAPGIGVGYRYMRNHFLFDIGLGAQYRHRWNRPYSIADIQAPSVDIEGYDYIGHHTWSNRSQTLQHVGVQLPLMLGAEWSGFYFLVGAKANVDLWGRRAEKGLYSLAGEYDRYIDPFSGMPENGFMAEEAYATNPVKMSLGWDVRVCAEMGYRIHHTARNTDPLWYMGLFAEYSVVSAAETYQPLLVGARLTILLPLPTRHACNCLPDQRFSKKHR